MARSMTRGAVALLVGLVGLGCGGEAPPSFAWQAVQSQLPGAMLSVWGTSATDVYAVGADAGDGTGPMAMRFDGTHWNRLDTGAIRGDLWWVSGVTPTQVYMVGSGGTVLRFDPTTGTSQRLTTPGTATLFGVWGSGERDVWAVGGDVDNVTGVLWHWDGTAWTAQDAPGGLNTSTLWYKVHGTAANDVTVCGTNGRILHYDGTRWTQETVPSEGQGPIFTVYTRGTQRLAVGGQGNGLVLSSTSGAPWQVQRLDTAAGLNGVFIPATGSPIAVGNSGEVFQRRGTTWTAVARPPQTQLNFHSVWVDPTGAVWAVGGNIDALSQGVIYHFGSTVPVSPVVTPDALTRCPTGSGVICTWAGSGVEGFNGDGHSLATSALYWPYDMTFGPDGTPYVLDWNNHRVRRVNATQQFETIVGTDAPGDGPPDNGDLMMPGAPGTTVAMNHPTDLMFLPSGKLLVVSWHNHKLRTWDPATGSVYVLMGRGPGNTDGALPTALLKQDTRAALDAAHNVLYVLDQGNSRIRRIDLAAGMATTIAGSMRGFAGDGGPAAMAQFNWATGENPEPEGGLALDAMGTHLYIADTENERIRVIDLVAGTISTFAGTGTAGFAGDGGPAAMAQLRNPQDLQFGPDGRLYVADTDNERIRAIDVGTDIITTVVGTGRRGYGGDRGPALQADLNRPHGIAFDTNGNLYVSDTLNNRIRRVWH